MGLLHLSKLAEFAPGIAEKKISKLPTVTEPKVWEFSAHPHLAEKSGTHVDIRLGNPVTGIAHSFVLPKVTALPGPGERAQVIPTFDHSIPYMNFTGQLKSGYGKGTVVRGRRTVAEVHHSTNSEEPGTKLRFNLYEGKHPEEFSIRLDKSGQWFLHNKTLTRERRPDIPSFKPEYKEISVDDVDAANHQQAMMPKLDGAHVIVDLQAGRSPRIFSYRESKVSPTGLIEHTHKLPELMQFIVPKELDKTILRAEVLGLKKGKAIESQQIGGLLNSKVWESRRNQEALGVKLKAFPFSVVKYRGKDVENLPYSQKREILEAVKVHIPELSPPPLISGPAQKIELLNAIRSQKHPLTKEGLVLVDPNGSGSFIKAKFAPDYDVYAREVHPAVNAKTGEPHDRAGSISYSWTPGGPVVGQLGGFKHDEARDMLANPDKYVGRVAKVKATKVFKNGKELGALYQPRFKEWHMDKGDIEKGAMWDGFVDELEKIALNALTRHMIEGTITPETISKARPFLRSHARMIKGINTGSENMANRLGVAIKEYANPVDYERRIDAAEAALSPQGLLNRKFLRHPIRGIQERLSIVRQNKPVEALHGFIGSTIARSSGGGAFVPTLTTLRGRVSSLISGTNQPTIHLIPRTPNADRLGAVNNSYLNAMIKRHEVDEARAMARGHKNWIPTSKEYTVHSGHADPSVLLNESRLMTQAPQGARQRWMDVRDNTNELDYLLDKGNVNYGFQTPLAGSKAERVALKNLRSTPPANV